MMIKEKTMMIDPTFFDAIHDRTHSGSLKYQPLPEDYRQPVIPMWVADMDFPSPPAVQAALKQLTEHGIYGYGCIDGSYLEAVSGWYQNRFDWTITAEEILPVPTVIYGIAATLRAVTRPGDAVLIMQPVYHPFPSIIEANGRRVVIHNLIWTDCAYTIDLKRLEQQFKEEKIKAVLFCSPHNPVGRVWSREELAALTALCSRYGVYIISDEIHMDFVYSGYRHLPTVTVSQELPERIVTLISPTKTFNLAGLQIASIIVGDPALRSRIERQCALTGCMQPNIMAVAAARAAYTEGEEWLKALLRYFEESRQILADMLAETERINVQLPEGTYLAWLDCRKLLPDPKGLNDFFLKKCGVWLNKGAMFGHGGEGFMRLNFACPHSVLKEALGRIREEAGRL